MKKSLTKANRFDLKGSDMGRGVGFEALAVVATASFITCGSTGRFGRHSLHNAWRHVEPSLLTQTGRLQQPSCDVTIAQTCPGRSCSRRRCSCGIPAEMPSALAWPPSLGAGAARQRCWSLTPPSISFLSSRDSVNASRRDAAPLLDHTVRPAAGRPDEVARPVGAPRGDPACGKTGRPAPTALREQTDKFVSTVRHVNTTCRPGTVHATADPATPALVRGGSAPRAAARSLRAASAPRRLRFHGASPRRRRPLRPDPHPRPVHGPVAGHAPPPGDGSCNDWPHRFS